MAEHACDPSIWDAEARELRELRSTWSTEQPEGRNKTLSQRRNLYLPPG